MQALVVRYPILAFLFCLINVSLVAQEKSSSSYYNLSFKQFEKLRAVNEPIDVENIDYALLNAAVFHESNRQRAKKGMHEFDYSKALEKASFEHSIDMVNRNFVNHVSKVRGKKTMSDRLKLVGITNVYAAENIALSYVLDMKERDEYYPPSQNGGYFSLEFKGTPIPYMSYLKAANRIVKQWMDSPPHRKNLLGKDFKYLGCGIYLEVSKNQDVPPMFKATQLFSSQDADYGKYPANINYQK